MNELRRMLFILVFLGGMMAAFALAAWLSGGGRGTVDYPQPPCEWCGAADIGERHWETCVPEGGAD